MAHFLTNIYNLVPRIKQTNNRFIIEPVGGVNPVESSPIIIPNIRGQLTFTLISGDNNFMCTFQVEGGFGEFRDAPTQNFYFVGGSETNCTIDNSTLNTIVVATPATDNGGREYTLVFTPFQTIAPTIEKTAGASIGDNTLTVQTTYFQVSPN